ncbi:hypothetical protein GGR04_004694 [Aureimonas pseudogalii]|uniref:Uncharacterized protein n=1 Tax=Aureimonas pseudogalii TaxID=1744844 RepID=A0A7W6MMG3_9HYPH|nr:hypothetical protein [Aureimonas pseudogalii]
MILAERTARVEAETGAPHAIAEAAHAEAKASGIEAVIAI